MSLISERFNSGSNGTNLQQAGVNVVHTVVNPNNGAALKFSNSEANPFTGGLVAVSTAGAGVQAEIRHDKTAANQGGQWLAFKVPAAAPTAASLDILQTRSGAVQHAGVRIHTDGSLRVLNLGSEIGGAAILTGFISSYAGQQVICRQTVIEGTTSANGRILTNLSLLSAMGSTVWAYDSGTTRNAGVIGTDTITSYRALKITAGAVPGNIVVYGHDANDGIATYVADPSLFAGAPSGSLPARNLVHQYDFTSWANKTSVAAVVTAGPALSVSVNGLVVSFTDVANRTTPVDVQFTVTGAGGNTVVTDTIPIGGTSVTQAIEEVVATAATGTAGDWA